MGFDLFYSLLKIKLVWNTSVNFKIISTWKNLAECRIITSVALEQIYPLLSFIIHAHFYQPPRDDPINGSIRFEKGSSPFPNWNEKIYHDCYRPNAEQGNFGKISFNIGPTLFSWLDFYHPETSKLIIQQDKNNVIRFGCGNAMAQSYNHSILPLLSRKDKFTQVSWGIADFEARFGRKPQGLWLPETAMDLETLDILALNGIEYTILAPWQAKEINLDTTEPCLVHLENGRKIHVFFYQRDLSTLISFNSYATSNADRFAEFQLRPLFNEEKINNGMPQVLTIASDGELYGHHQPLRNFFLERLVDGAVKPLNLVPTYPALWLKDNVVRKVVRINENTSWSCHHGLGRWLGDCNCTPGDRSWKRYLRNVINHIADDLDDIYYKNVQPFCDDPWLLRNQYIQVIMKRMSFDQFLLERCDKYVSSDNSRMIYLLLESQRERQRMYTSCGWYFEDFDRIEPRNNVAYAAQAVFLAKKATGDDLSKNYFHELQLVRSSISGISAEQIFINHLEKAESGFQILIPITH